MASRTAEKETKYLESVVKSRPDSLLFSRLADAYRKEGNIAQAIELCTSGLSYYPDYTTGRILLGRCYLEQQKYAEAVEAFTAVCSRDRRNQVAIKMLADIFSEQGMKEKAGDLYALLHTMDPGNSSITHLSSKHHSSGNNDLFAILGLVSAGGVQSTLFSESPQQEFVDVQDTGIPQENDIISAEDFSGSSPFDQDAISNTDGVFSGDDVSDRMSSLFGEGTAGGQTALTDSPFEADGVEKGFAGNEDIDSLIAGMSLESSAVSGDDVSDRIGALFSEGGREAPEQGLKELHAEPFEDQSAAEPVSDPLASLAGQDFDFSGMGETSSAENPDEAALQDTLTFSLPEKEELDTAASLTNTDSLKTLTESPAPDFEADLLVPGEGMQGATVTGDDFTNRLEDLFGEAPPPTEAGRDDVSLVNFSEESAELNSTAVSGDDFADRLNDLFGDSQKSSASEIGTGSVSELADAGTVTGDDFTGRLDELVGGSPEQPLAEGGEEFAEGEVQLQSLQDSIEEIDFIQPEKEAVLPVEEISFDEPEFNTDVDVITPEHTAAVSGDELADRLGELFADDTPSGSDAKEPDLSMAFDIPDEDLPAGMSLTEEAADLSDVNVGLFTDASGADATTSGSEPFSSMASENVIELVSPEADADNVLGTDVQNRLDEMFEGVNDDQSDQPSGDDVSDRISGLFALPAEKRSEQDSAEELFVHDDRNLHTFDSGMADVSDAPQSSAGDIFTDDNDANDGAVGMDALPESGMGADALQRRDGSETTFDQLLPQTGSMDALYLDEADPDEVLSLDKGSAAEGNEFMPAEFEETLQFDNALFEKMLNPDTEEAQDALPPVYAAETGIGEVSADTLDMFEEAEAAPDESFEMISAAELDNAPEHGEELQTLVDFDIGDQEADGADVVTLDIDSGAAPDKMQLSIDEPEELVLESTATFEVDALGMFTSSTTQPAMEHTGKDESEELIDLISDDSSYIDRSKLNFTNQVVSDNTEIIEVGPSGDDVASKLDDMFPETRAHAPLLPEKSAVSPADEVVDLTKEYLLDDIAEITGTDGSDDEDDAALIETMQMSSIADIPGFIHDGQLSTDGDDLVMDAETLPAADDFASAQVTGADIEDRLDAFFPEADLLSLSSENTLLPEDELEASGEAVSDFYTISGTDAVGSEMEELPAELEKVEFIDADDMYEDQTVELQRAEVDEAILAGKPATTFTDEMLSDNDFPQETIEMSMETINSARTAPLDERDKPFDIPDHVLTPTLADIYFQQGQYRLALQVFERLLAQDPDNPKLLSRFHEIRSIAEQGIPVQPEKALQTPDAAQKRPPLNKPKASDAPKKADKPLAGVKIKKTVKASHKHAPRPGRGGAV